MRAIVMLTTGLCAFIAAGVAACGPQAQEEAAAPPPTETEVDELTEARLEAAEAYMEGVIQPTADALWGEVGWVINETGEHDLSPKNDAEWAEARDHAVAVMDIVEELKRATFAWDDGEWETFCDQVIQAASLSVTAAEHQSVDEMFDAGEALDHACESCHLHYTPDELPPPL